MNGSAPGTPASRGLAAVVDLLACPHCQSPLSLSDRVLGCAGRHRFDVARQGYVNLLAGPPPQHADSVAMVQARSRFLNRGHYAPLRQALATLVGDVVLDAGSGPGWYVGGLDPRTRGLALDISVPAVRAAARAHPQVGAVVADTWGRLPVGDRVVDTVLAVFAPRHVAEFARVLIPGGRLVVVTPARDHLIELVRARGLLGMEPDKQARLVRTAIEHLDLVDQDTVRFTLELSADELDDLVAMGPNAFHATADSAASPVPRVTASFVITQFARR